MIETIRNAWRIPDLRKKILFTVFILVVYRFGSAIYVPFVDVKAFADAFEASMGDTIFGMYNMMSGGAFASATIFALSIQPYINASIIMNLLTVGIPALERMVKEGGEEGRKKVAAITRYATVGLGLLMGFAYYTMLRNQFNVVTDHSLWAAAVIILSFTAGTAFIMWLGEQVTEFGIGNGISIILFASIVSRFPATIVNSISGVISGTMLWYVALGVLVLALAVVGFVVFITNAERRIPIQYAKRMVGRRMYGGQSTHLPLKVNMSGVMPIIFAQSFVSFPSTIGSFFNPSSTSFWGRMLSAIGPGQPVYMVIYFLLIIGFSYFYTAIQFNPVEIANNLKQNGGFIPGFRPGKSTSDFIKKVLNKITLFGALFLGVIALLPMIMGSATNISGLTLGGTSVLIVVGVALETIKQMESQMLMRHYKGFLE